MGDMAGSGPRSGRDLPDAIEWHEGMLLAPQHFQQATLRAEEIVHYHALTLHPYHWGIRHLKTDPVALVGGVFRVLELEAVLPDGLVVTHMQGDDGPALELDLGPRKEEMLGRALPVHLALPVRRPGGRTTGGELPRYRSAEGGAVSDETSGDNPLAIPRLKPRLSLEAADTLAQKYVGFPLARVTLREEAFVEDAFDPPRLWVPEASPLGEVAGELAKRLREKASFLAERGAAQGGSGAAGPEARIQLHGLVAALPVLEALLKSGRAHPYALYLALMAVLGHLTAVGGGTLPPVLPPYDHDDALACFRRAADFAQRMLDRVSELYQAIPFNATDTGFALPLRPDWAEGGLVVGARAGTGASELDVIAWMDGALIGDARAQATMRERRVLGAARARIDRDEALDVAPSRGMVLFRVEPDPEFVDVEGTLEIRGSRTNPPVEILAYVAAERGAA